MFHPSIISGHFPKITIDVPIRSVEIQVQGCIQKIKAIILAVFEAIGRFIHTVYQTITCSQKAKILPFQTGSYKVCFKQPHLIKKTEQSPYVILTLDGGGVRGKASLAALKIIEEELGTNLIKAVDCIAGVSTGGIIAAALSVPALNDPKEPRYTAKDVDDLYNKLAEEVFASSWWHKAGSLCGAIGSKYVSPRSIIESIIGDVSITKSVAKKLLITSLDLLSGQLICFENTASPGSEYLKSKNIRCVCATDDVTFTDAVTATSAAPTYFPTVKFRDYNLTDGGVAVNNPAQIATLLAMSKEAKDRPILVISIGTGKLPSQPITDKESLSWGVLQWVSPLINYLLDANQDQADVQMNLMAESNPNINYVRFQMLLDNSEEAEMDNASPANMQRLEDLGTKCFNDFLDKGGRERVIAPLKAKLSKI